MSSAAGVAGVQARWHITPNFFNIDAFQPRRLWFLPDHLPRGVSTKGKPHHHPTLCHRIGGKEVPKAGSVDSASRIG